MRSACFSARWLQNYVGEYITTYSATSAARNIYRYALWQTNAGISYQLRPAVTLIPS